MKTLKRVEPYLWAVGVAMAIAVWIAVWEG